MNYYIMHSSRIKTRQRSLIGVKCVFDLFEKNKIKNYSESLKKTICVIKKKLGLLNQEHLFVLQKKYIL